MNTTLLILAAGMANRYGSVKQLDHFGPNGETLIDYSIYDAIKAGFNKVVFVIREEFADHFKAVFEPRLQGKIKTAYAFQSSELGAFGIDQSIPRTKPWGTAHALLAAQHCIDEPFCVINADDFYGREVYQQMHHFLTHDVRDTHFGLMGYQLDKTLSPYGSVSRGICSINAQGHLSKIQERVKIYLKDGTIFYEENHIQTALAPQTRVSMNFWGFTPKIFSLTMPLFKEFISVHAHDPSAEFFIPSISDALIKKDLASFTVIPTQSSWFGVTYKEDKEVVQENIKQLITEGRYPKDLWSTKVVIT